MTNPKSPWRVERTLTGDLVTVEERTLQLVAQVTGWRGTNGGKNGGGARLRLQPVEVVVREGDGSERRVPITDPTRDTTRGIVVAGLLIAALSWLLTGMLERKT